MEARDAEQPIYREWQIPNYASFLANLLVLPSIWLMVAPISGQLSFAVAFTATLVSIVIRLTFSKRIVLTRDQLLIGKARIPRSAIGSAESIALSNQFHEKGPGLDARAFLALRSLPGLVKIELTDPSDPTPYLLVSTRRPEKFVRAIND